MEIDTMNKQPMPRLTLFQIESELLGLLDQRADAEERREEADKISDEAASAACDEELQVIDLLMRQYVEQRIQKADSIASALHHFDTYAETRLQESDRLKRLAEHDAETAQRIRDMVIDVMEAMGKKKIEGQYNTLAVQGNGGLQPLNIAQPEMVPDKFVEVTVRMSKNDWAKIELSYEGDPLETLKIISEDPSNSRIRKVLEAAQRSEAAIEILAETEGWEPQHKQYGLSQIERVPGCRLEPRGKHLRIR